MEYKGCGQTIEMKRSVGDEGDLEVFQSPGLRQEEKRFGGQGHWGYVFQKYAVVKRGDMREETGGKKRKRRTLG